MERKATLKTRIEIPEDYRRIARFNKRSIIKELLKLPINAQHLGYMVSRRAQEMELIDPDKPVVRGKTLVLWAETDSIKQHLPNEWACISAVSLLLEGKSEIDFNDDNIYWAMVYYLSPSDDLDVIRQNKTVIDQYISKYVD